MMHVVRAVHSRPVPRHRPLSFTPATAACAAVALLLLSTSAASAVPAPGGSHPGPTASPHHARTVNVMNAPYNAAGDGTTNDRL